MQAILLSLTLSIILVLEIECGANNKTKATPKHKIPTYSYSFDMFGKQLIENAKVLTNLYTEAESHEQPTNFLESELSTWTMKSKVPNKFTQPKFPDLIEKANTNYKSTRPSLPKVTLKVADERPWNISIRFIDVGGDTKAYPTIINRETPNYWAQFTPIFQASNVNKEPKELTVFDQISSFLKDINEKISDLRTSFNQNLPENMTDTISGKLKPTSSIKPTKSIKRSLTTSSTTEVDLVWLTDVPTASTLEEGAVLLGMVTYPTTISLVAMTLLQEFNTTNYLSVAFKKMCEYIINKNSEDVRSVLQHLVIIVDKIRIERPLRLLWLKEPLTTVFDRVVGMLSALPMDELKSHAIILHNAVRIRRAVFDQTVNQLIDRADDLVEPKDGEKLFEVVLEFRDYRLGTRPAYTLCEALFEAFEAPFRYETKSEVIKKFAEDVNKAFLDRFPMLHA